MPVYHERIVDMVQANKQTLEVDFIQLSKHQTALAIWAIDAPAEMFELFSEVAKEAVAEKFQAYMQNVHSDIFVRMTGLPVIEPVRNIRCGPGPFLAPASVPACLSSSLSKTAHVAPRSCQHPVGLWPH